MGGSASKNSIGLIKRRSMGYKKASFIENLAEKIGLIPNLHKDGHQEFDNDMRQFTDEEVAQMYENFPPPEKWDDWVEYDPKSWPKKATSLSVTTGISVSIARTLITCRARTGKAPVLRINVPSIAKVR